jgi:hypothetical protein
VVLLSSCTSIANLSPRPSERARALVLSEVALSLSLDKIR